MAASKDRSASPFAALAALRDALPEGPRPEEPARPSSTPATADAFADKVVVARSKKGRGGKTVTTITGVRGDAAALEALAQDLRRALGCGASVEDAIIVVQGEQVQRVRALLEARGARRIVVGS